MISPVIGRGPNLYQVDVPVALGVTVPSYARGATAAEARAAVEADYSKMTAAVAMAKVAKIDLTRDVVV